VKHLLALQQKSSERRRQGLFVVEGRRELQHCAEASLEVECLFVCDDGSGTPELDSLLSCFPHADVLRVTPAVYERIAYRGSTEGIIGVVHARTVTLDELPLRENPLIVVLESVEKPGNLGAVLRSADAAGADAVIVCDPLTDLYNPNLIRSSIGAIFTVPCVATTTQDCIAFLQRKGIQILTAQLQDSDLYYDVPMTGPTAIVMGTESTGLTQPWRQAATAHIRIPMRGRLDSLNVSVSAAILLFEAVRQRLS
jgi:TrmH family RNA methyltransferase